MVVVGGGVGVEEVGVCVSREAEVGEIEETWALIREVAGSTASKLGRVSAVPE